MVNPSEVVLSNGESADVTLTNYRPGDVKTLVYGSSGLPDGSSVTFTTVAKPAVTGTNQQTVYIAIGPDTQAGVYVLDLNAQHIGKTGAQSNFVLVNVDCTPAMILGIGQPASAFSAGGNEAIIKVNPIGSLGLHYQWYRGHSGSIAFPSAGQTTSTLRTLLSGEYWVQVSNACGSVDSATARVSALP